MRDHASILGEAARSLSDDDLVFALALARRQCAACEMQDLLSLLNLKEDILRHETDRRRLES